VGTGEQDREILQLALSAFDHAESSIEMRVNASAVMMHQLGIPQDESGGPPWWNDDEEENLCHPLMVQAVEETRRFLTQDDSDSANES